MTKSRRRDDIYIHTLPNGKSNPRYNRIKHSQKLKWEAKLALDANQITERQYRLALKEAELVLTGQWQHKGSSFETSLVKAQYVQEYDRDSKKSVLSTDLSKSQLPLSERQKQADKRAVVQLAVRLFKQDYPSSEVSLKACDKTVIQSYLRRARYIIKNTNGVKRVESHNPNKVKPLKVRPDYPAKVVVTALPTKSSLESKSDMSTTPEEPTTPITLPETSLEAPTTPKTTKATLWAEMKGTRSYIDSRWLLENHGVSYAKASLSQLQEIYSQLGE
jgi:hypothetical protein